MCDISDSDADVKLKHKLLIIFLGPVSVWLFLDNLNHLNYAVPGYIT